MQQFSKCAIPLGVLLLAAICLLENPSCADPASEYARAMQLYTDKGFAEAVSVFSTVATADPALAPSAKWMLGACYRELKDYPAAVSALEGAATICGTNQKLEAAIKDQLSMCYLAAEKWAKALPMLQELTTLRPAKVASYWCQIGICYKNLGQHAKATDAWKSIIGDPSLGAEAIDQMVRYYSESEGWSSALDAFQKMLREKPNRATACWYAIGRCRQGLGHYILAISAFRKSTGDPSLRKNALLAAATCYFELHDWSKALECFRALLIESPDHFALCWHGIGTCYRELERYTEAIDALKKVSKDPVYGTDALAQLDICESETE